MASCGGDGNLFEAGGSAGAEQDAAAAGASGSAGAGGVDAGAGGSNAGAGGANAGGSAGDGGTDGSAGGAAGSAGDGGNPDAGCPSGTKLCSGTCVATSDPGFGCEGPCTPCAADHAVPACNIGSCAIGSCLQPYADCNGIAADGCEVDTSGDLNNCGGCAKQCVIAGGVALCTQGACVIAGCSMGYADCDQVPGNGCEVGIVADPMNCGSCGHTCAAPNTTPACANYQCVVGVCNTGFGDCNGVASDGCEVNLATNPIHCSSCNVQCSYPNGVAACANGQCAFVSCNAGYGNCDANAANGCESVLASDAGNCGSCGLVCAGGSCVNGLCQAPAPVKLADAGSSNFDLAVDATYVYFGSGAGVQRVAKTGGTPTVLTPGGTNGLAIDSLRVYFADMSASAIRSVPIGGGTASTLVSGLVAPWRVATNGTNVYFTDSSNQMLYRVPVGGGVNTVMASGMGGASGLALDASFVYFGTDSGGVVARVPLGGGTVTTLVSGESRPMRVAVDATSVYFTTYTANGAVKKVPLAGGSPITLASGQNQPIGIAADNGWVYWTATTTVQKVPLAGGTPVVLASGQGSANCIAIDATRVYWIDNANHSVNAVAK
jgi:hypothetical protein